ncbi:hypothetical protein HGB07_04980, partial [Candidatus Roizmanbacteria bacterium]|nr:hypothetical protein [Candidatus Roizmanbacteria bacterium]
MSQYLFIALASFLIHFFLIVPFINFLYKMKLQRANQKTLDAFNKPTPVFDKFHCHKQGIPVGGGLLVVLVTTVLFAFFLLVVTLFNKTIQTNYPSAINEIKIIFFTFISFALLGVYDDLNKIFLWKKQSFFGLRMRHKLVIEIILALVISIALFSDLRISIIHIPFFGVFQLSYFYILFAAFVIVAFANAVNITDGL